MSIAPQQNIHRTDLFVRLRNERRRPAMTAVTASKRLLRVTTSWKLAVSWSGDFVELFLDSKSPNCSVVFCIELNLVLTDRTSGKVYETDDGISISQIFAVAVVIIALLDVRTFDFVYAKKSLYRMHSL